MKCLFAFAPVTLLLFTGCGYQVGGKADLIPKTVHTIAIPACNNRATTRYKLTDQLPEAIAREFISRTHYRVVPNPGAADAVLNCTVLTYGSVPTIIDPTTNLASVVELRMTMNVNLVDTATKKVLFSRPNFEMRDRYEIAAGVVNGAPTFEQRNYFEETDSAVKRASEAAAQQIVSAILENF
jgi:hypothetical protein